MEYREPYNGAFNGQDIDNAIKEMTRWSSPNLLDNWYFARPINQRGQAAYRNEGWAITYGIDRWYILSGEWDVSAHKLTAVGAFGRIGQRFDEKWLIGKTVTFSVLVSSLEGGDLLLYHEPGDIYEARINEGSFGVVSCTFEVVDPGNGINGIFIALNTANASAVIEAAKLEPGHKQTLAHQDEAGNWTLNAPPPSEALELTECQRYFQVFSSESLRPAKAVDFRPPMRADPAFGTVVSGSQNYYTASADL